MALSELFVKNIKSERRKMFRDDRNLYLEVHPNGSKFWKYRYWEGGKEKKVALGKYPAVSLREARQARDDVAHKIDTGVSLLPASAVEPHAPAFQDIAVRWYETKINGVRSAGHAETVISRLDRFIFPKIGAKTINEITAPELLKIFSDLQDAGIIETSHRVKQIVGQVFRFAIALGLCERDITADLQGALKPRKSIHRSAATTPREIKALVQAISVYGGGAVVRTALWFSAYTFARPGEVRHAEWSEIDFDEGEWRIPAEKMKMRRSHIVPLAPQVVQILRGLHPFTGHGRYIFPNARNFAKGDSPMSEIAVLAAIRRMGFEKSEMTAHGFRSMASTALNEHGFSPDIIERQLAHSPTNAIRAAYNHAEYLPERRKMMTWWADWLDGLAK